MCAWCWADVYCCSHVCNNGQRRLHAWGDIGGGAATAGTRHRDRHAGGTLTTTCWPNFGARDSQLGTTLCHSSFQTVHAMNALSSSRAHPARPAFGRAALANSGRMANSVRVNAFGNRDGQGFSSEALSVLQRRIAEQQQQQKADKARRARPQLPMGVLMFEEMSADAKLIDRQERAARVLPPPPLMCLAARLFFLPWRCCIIPCLLPRSHAQVARASVAVPARRNPGCQPGVKSRRQPGVKRRPVCARRERAPGRVLYSSYWATRASEPAHAGAGWRRRHCLL